MAALSAKSARCLVGGGGGGCAFSDSALGSEAVMSFVFMARSSFVRRGMRLDVDRRPLDELLAQNTGWR
jgi:hypothetical protein